MTKYIGNTIERTIQYITVLKKKFIKKKYYEKCIHRIIRTYIPCTFFHNHYTYVIRINVIIIIMYIQNGRSLHKIESLC